MNYLATNRIPDGIGNTLRYVSLWYFHISYTVQYLSISFFVFYLFSGLLEIPCYCALTGPPLVISRILLYIFIVAPTIQHYLLLLQGQQGPDGPKGSRGGKGGKVSWRIFLQYLKLQCMRFYNSLHFPFYARDHFRFSGFHTYHRYATITVGT